MKRFRLLEVSTNGTTLNYIVSITEILRIPLQEMPWLEDAEKSIKISRLLEDKHIGDVLELEDADHIHLCKKVRNARWGAIDEHLLVFANTILNATESVLNE